MGWIKVQKTRSYFKRFQVQFRRRREGKTDYQARKALIIQDKNKYATPRYRFVVRRTNKDIICQVTAAELTKDRVVCAAYSHELPRYGIPVGLTNYAAAYATGLLCGRRLLEKLSVGVKENALAKLYPGLDKATGEEYHPDENENEEVHAFKAFLDIGLARASTGARVFAAMKGAVDAGLNIPHSMKRFPGYSKDGFDSSALRDRIMGKHVGDYMAELKAEDEETYKKRFSRYIAAKVEPLRLESMYTKAHAAIRANPQAVKEKFEIKKPVRQARLTLKERKEKLDAKKLEALKQLTK